MRTCFTIFIYLSVLLAGFNAAAEYRVFVLKINDSTTGQSRTVTTTLDHLQYASYYPTLPTEIVSIQETWMCRYYRSDIGQDQNQSYCPNPKTAAAPLNHGGYGGSYDASVTAASPEASGATGSLGKATFTDPQPPRAPANAQPR